MIDWFERVSDDLVHLGLRPWPEVRGAMAAVDRGVRDHMRALDPILASTVSLTPELTTLRTVLRSDHIRFFISLDQLEGLCRVVDGEDHGGHRQALGQYGRLLAESLQRHRGDERGLFRAIAIT
jgi:hypothetical protein